MPKGIYDTRSMSVIIGKNIRKARVEQTNLSRQAFCDEINKCELRPMKNNVKVDLNPERLKQWEYGNNPVDLEWIPSFCYVLGVDVGYLFGDYEEKTRQLSDIVRETGLTEKSASGLHDVIRKNPLWISYTNEFIQYCGLHGETLTKLKLAIDCQKYTTKETEFNEDAYHFSETLKKQFNFENTKGTIQLPEGVIPLSAKHATEFYIDCVVRDFRAFLNSFITTYSEKKEKKDNG